MIDTYRLGQRASLDQAARICRRSSFRFASSAWLAMPSDAHAGSDSARYAVTALLTEFLAERGGEKRVVELAAKGQKRGWDLATSDYYGMRSVADLQVTWQEWVTRTASKDMDNSRQLRRLRRVEFHALGQK